MINGGSFSPVKVTPRRTVHRADAPVPVIVTFLHHHCQVLSGQSSRTTCLSKFGDFRGQTMVTYLIDVNRISLGNVVGHYGRPEAVEKTVSHMFRKLRLLSNLRHSPVGYPLAF